MMETDHGVLQRVLREYSPIYELREATRLGNAGGFSGACLWRVTTPAGMFALRRWPKGSISADQLRTLHGVLEKVVLEGINYVPLPARTASGQTFVEAEGYLWQLEPWLPGQADFWQRPTAAKLQAAMQALARFHLTASLVSEMAGYGVSPAYEARQRELRVLLGRGLDELERAVPAGHWPEMDRLAEELLGRIRRLRIWATQVVECRLPQVPLQPVIRDVWHDHILFEGDRVTGMVDFGCLGIDSVSVDIGRLAGSLIGENQARWREALAYYEKVRPLSPAERWLSAWGRVTGTIGGGLVWLKRHYLKGATWDRRPGILQRLRHFIERLDQLRASGLTSRPGDALDARPNVA